VKNNKLAYYIFIEELNEIIIQNIIRLKRKKLILNVIISIKNSDRIIKFAKANQIQFFVIDDVKFAIKNNASGVFLTSKNKCLRNNITEKTKLMVIGSAHNQFEYYLKQRQNCTTIMLSPIFYNDKYSNHKILNQIKFNLITLNWKTKICALGGISYKNVMLINLTKSTSIGIKSLIAKKKPVHN
jgi:thiamine monophosphate synthase